MFFFPSTEGARAGSKTRLESSIKKLYTTFNLQALIWSPCGLTLAAPARALQTAHSVAVGPHSLTQLYERTLQIIINVSLITNNETK